MSLIQSKEKCLFCRFVMHTEKSYIIWEKKTHLAFLTIFPNTPGVTVVIPKVHMTSNVFRLSQKNLSQLTCAAQKVAKILEKKLQVRIALVFEGFGIDHAHAKLFPMHGTSLEKEKWSPIHSSVKTWSEQYGGFISSHDGPRASGDNLQAMQKLLIQ